MEQQTQNGTTTAAKLRFVLDNKTTQVVLPTDLPLGDMLPAVLARFGSDIIERGVHHEGWVLRNDTERVLDEERTPAQLGLADGDTLHFGPRATNLAPIDYDDVVDGVGEQIRDDPGAWSPSATRAMLLVGFVTAVVTGLMALLAGGDPTLRAYLVAGVAVLLLGGAAAMARAAADPLIGTVLAGVAALHAGAAGWLTVDATDAQHVMTHGSIAGAAVIVALSVGLVAVADAALLFIGALAAATSATVVLTVGSMASLTASQAAVIGVGVAMAAHFVVPGLASWLSSLPFPLLPTPAAESADEDAKDDSAPARLVINRKRAILNYTDALHVANGLVTLAWLAMLVPDTDTSAVVVAVLVTFLLLLRGWRAGSVVRHWALYVPATTAIVVIASHAAATVTPALRLLAVWPLVVVVAIAVLIMAELPAATQKWRIPGRVLLVLEVAVLAALVASIGAAEFWPAVFSW